MEISDRIRRIYEKRPYPFGDRRALRDRPWRLPPVEWIEAFRCLGPRSGLDRILVAGCGDGTEAFDIRRRLPHAEIVGVDFSGRSIARAKSIQRSAGSPRPIRFVELDLADPSFPERLGTAFDFISCHGVLSYIVDYPQVLQNLARCLHPQGALYLGVNGSEHLSNRLRRFLPAFGFAMEEMEESAALRKVLNLGDAVTELAGLPSLAGKPSGYLAGDIFGALIRNLPLAQWVAAAQSAGLHFLGTPVTMRLFRPIADRALHPLLLPRSRSELAALLDHLLPSGFYQLLFSKSPEANPPWKSPSRLLAWRPMPARLYRMELPALGKIRDRLRLVTCKSRPFNARMECRLPEWAVALLQPDRGRRTLRELVAELPFSIPARDLREQLYLLYQLGLLNLLPPARGADQTESPAGAGQ